jgi:hypothetical protein
VNLVSLETLCVVCSLCHLCCVLWMYSQLRVWHVRLWKLPPFHPKCPCNNPRSVIETRIQHRAHTLLWCIQYSDHSIRTNQLKSSYQTSNDFVHFNSEVRLECAYNSGHIHFCSVLEVMTPPHYSPSYSHPSLTCLNSSNILKYPTSFTYHQYTTYCALHSRSPHNTVTYILIESCTFGLTLRN